MVKGRRYFQCRDGHGIFTTASQIRFIPVRRWSVSLCFSVATDSPGWFGSRVVSVLDSGAEGPGFKSQPRLAATLLGNDLRQTVHTHRTFVHQAAKLAAPVLRVAGVTAGLPESTAWQPTAGLTTHVTCRLTAKNWDQLRYTTLGNRVLADIKIGSNKKKILKLPAY